MNKMNTFSLPIIKDKTMFAPDGLNEYHLPNYCCIKKQRVIVLFSTNGKKLNESFRQTSVSIMYIL
jgi:hypothetical protein